jgi:hypothetical protein
MFFSASLKKLRAVFLIPGLALLAGAQNMTPVPQNSTQQTTTQKSAAQQPPTPQPPSQGLVVVTPKEVQEKRREYAEAYKDYKDQNDPQLADDIVNHPEKQAEIRKRIEDQRGRTHKMLDAQGKYYDAVRSLYRQVYEAVAKPAAQANRDDDKKRLQEISDGLFEQRQRYEEESAKEKSALVRTQYDELIAELRKAEDANRSYQILLDRMKQNDTDLAEARAKALQSQNDVIAAFDSLVKDTQRRTAARDKQYDLYLGLLDRKPANPPPPKPLEKTGDPGTAKTVEPPKPDPPKSDPPKPDPPKSDPPKPPDSSTKPASVSLTGNWTGKDPKNGMQITLQITDDGSKIKGSFTAVGIPSSFGLGVRSKGLNFSGDKVFIELTSGYTFALESDGQLEINTPTASRIGLTWTAPSGKLFFDGFLDKH